MILSESKKFIYVHIYKTGGSTITDLLSPYVDGKFKGKDATKEGFGWQSSWHIKGQQHAKIADALPILDSLKIDYSDYFVFTFVRNPYSWLLSVWSNFYSFPLTLSSENIVQQLKNLYRKRFRPSLAGSVRFGELFPDRSFKNFILFLEQVNKENKKKEKQYWGTYDQYSFIENSKNINFDLIGKFENFEEDVKQILQELNIDCPDKIPHRTYRNVEENKNQYLNYYDEQSLAIVNRLFQRDFKTFNYPQISNILS